MAPDPAVFESHYSGTILPPNVEGSQKGKVQLTLHSPTWSYRGAPQHLAVGVSWWGEPAQGTVIPLPLNCKVTVEYDVVCGPRLFSRYLRDASTVMLSFFVRDEDKLVGKSPVDVRSLDVGKHMKGTLPILGGGGQVLGRIAVGVALSYGDMLSSFELNEHLATTDTALPLYPPQPRGAVVPSLVGAQEGAANPRTCPTNQLCAPIQQEKPNSGGAHTESPPPPSAFNHINKSHCFPVLSKGTLGLLSVPAPAVPHRSERPSPGAGLTQHSMPLALAPNNKLSSRSVEDFPAAGSGDPLDMIIRKAERLKLAMDNVSGGGLDCKELHPQVPVPPPWSPLRLLKGSARHMRQQHAAPQPLRDHASHPESGTRYSAGFTYVRTPLHKNDGGLRAYEQPQTRRPTGCLKQKSSAGYAGCGMFLDGDLRPLHDQPHLGAKAKGRRVVAHEPLCGPCCSPPHQASEGTESDQETISSSRSSESLQSDLEEGVEKDGDASDVEDVLIKALFFEQKGIQLSKRRCPEPKSPRHRDLHHQGPDHPGPVNQCGTESLESPKGPSTLDVAPTSRTDHRCSPLAVGLSQLNLSENGRQWVELWGRVKAMRGMKALADVPLSQGDGEAVLVEVQMPQSCLGPGPWTTNPSLVVEVWGREGSGPGKGAQQLVGLMRVPLDQDKIHLVSPLQYEASLGRGRWSPAAGIGDTLAVRDILRNQVVGSLVVSLIKETPPPADSNVSPPPPVPEDLHQEDCSHAPLHTTCPEMPVDNTGAPQLSPQHQEGTEEDSQRAPATAPVAEGQPQACVPSEILLAVKHTFDVMVHSASQLPALPDLQSFGSHSDDEEEPVPLARYIKYCFPGEDEELYTEEVGLEPNAHYEATACHTLMLSPDEDIGRYLQGPQGGGGQPLRFEMWDKWSNGEETLVGHTNLPLEALLALLQIERGGQLDSEGSSRAFLLPLTLDPESLEAVVAKLEVTPHLQIYVAYSAEACYSEIGSNDGPLRTETEEEHRVERPEAVSMVNCSALAEVSVALDPRTTEASESNQSLAVGGQSNQGAPDMRQAIVLQGSGQSTQRICSTAPAAPESSETTTCQPGPNTLGPHPRGNLSVPSVSAELCVEVVRACGLLPAVKEAQSWAGGSATLMGKAHKLGPHPYATLVLLPPTCEAASQLPVLRTPFQAQTFCPQFHHRWLLPLHLTPPVLQTLQAEDMVVELWHHCPRAQWVAAVLSSGRASNQQHDQARDVFLGSASCSLGPLLTRNVGIQQWLPLKSRRGEPVGAVQVALHFTHIAGAHLDSRPGGPSPLDMYPSWQEVLYPGEPLLPPPFISKSFTGQLARCTLYLEQIMMQAPEAKGGPEAPKASQYHLAYRLPGSSSQHVTPSKGVSRSDLGKYNRSWQVALQYCGVHWVRAGEALLMALKKYPLLVSAFWQGPGSTGKGEGSKAQGQSTRASIPLGSSEVDMAPLLIVRTTGKRPASRWLSGTYPLINPMAKDLANMRVRLKVLLELDPPGAPPPCWTPNNTWDLTDGPPGLLEMQNELTERTSPERSHLENRVPEGNQELQGDHSQEAASAPGGVSAPSPIPGHEPLPEAPGAIHEISFPPPPNVKPPADTSTMSAQEGHHQPTARQVPPPMSNASVTTATPPDSSLSLLTQCTESHPSLESAEVPGGEMTLEGVRQMLQELRQDSTRMQTQAEGEHINICIESALNLALDPLPWDQQHVMYALFPWAPNPYPLTTPLVAAQEGPSGALQAKWFHCSTVQYCQRTSGWRQRRDHGAVSPGQEDLLLVEVWSRVVSEAVALQLPPLYQAGSATYEEGDVLVGRALVDLQPLHVLGTIEGWYNITNEQHMLVGQVKVLVMPVLPGTSCPGSGSLTQEGITMSHLMPAPNSMALDELCCNPNDLSLVDIKELEGDTSEDPLDSLRSHLQELEVISKRFRERLDN